MRDNWYLDYGGGSCLCADWFIIFTQFGSTILFLHLDFRDWQSARCQKVPSLVHHQRTLRSHDLLTEHNLDIQNGMQ
jgi:hypothetical protein